jgi:hypothetical protein
MTTIVDHYGLHFTESGVGLLVQNEVQHALGVELKFDIKVRKPRRTMSCPHKIDLSAAEDHPLRRDAFVDVMLPLPKPVGSDAVLVEDTPKNQEVLRQLLRLSSPDGTAHAVPLWLYRPETFIDLLKLTNVQPLVINGYQQLHHARLKKVIETARHLPRRLVVILPSLPLATLGKALTTRLSPKDLAKLPLERIGSARLVEHMLSRGN